VSSTETVLIVCPRNVVLGTDIMCRCAICSIHKDLRSLENDDLKLVDRTSEGGGYWMSDYICGSPLFDISLIIVEHRTALFARATTRRVLFL
jgi:hypothetical protein